MAETLTLQDALKLADLAVSGGQAKLLIQRGQVKLNGRVETRCKHKLHEGDVIKVGDDEFVWEPGRKES